MTINALLCLVDQDLVTAMGDYSNLVQGPDCLAITWIAISSIVLFHFFFALIILYSRYLEYDSPLVPSASGLAG